MQGANNLDSCFCRNDNVVPSAALRVKVVIRELEIRELERKGEKGKKNPPSTGLGAI